MPVTQNVQAKLFQTTAEVNLAKVCRKAFLSLLLQTQQFQLQRIKRLASNGDVKVQVSSF